MSRFITPPATPHIRTATASIATAVSVALSVFAASLIPGSALYAVLTAGGVALGAASGIAALRHRGGLRLFQWLSALGGIIILLIGIVVAIAKVGASAKLGTAGLMASYYLIPSATLACYIGGIGQLPAKWMAPVFMATAGAATAGWFSLGAGTGVEHFLIVFSAVFSLMGCAYPVREYVVKRPPHPAAALVTLAALLLGTIMLYFIGIVVAPSLAQPHPTIVAWSFMCAGVLATIAGLLARRA
ncbi:hypothetical protein [Corynebacterium crudilactis]|uniref:Uncharacterized protein n=1 Tax=Corynebacterium crudilactis TaxID=1652495 RepID=A0A172QU89_9CORY|nr:hypothetical protein [Corynebacterium crudilactis]ANE04279.1 hypothetical protein ccrud_08725 [Corynebacterium crudilactis]